MITRQAKRLNRQHENEEGHQHKKQRTESSAETVQTTKITDLNDDCLMKMFCMLDLESLFDVSVANEYLRPAAREVYRNKFGKKLVKIYPFDGRFVLKESDNDISIRGIKTCLQYLRCFGPSINDLSIEYKYSTTKRYEHVHEYIEQYCGKNLKAIHIDYSTGFGNVLSFKKIIADLLHGNRKLKSLKIYDYPLDELHANAKGTKFEEWLDLIKDQSSIVELCIDSRFNEIISAQVQRIISEHSALIVLNLPRYDLTSNDAHTAVHQLKSLKEMEFSLPHVQTDKFKKWTQMDCEWYGRRVIHGRWYVSTYKLQRDMPNGNLTIKTNTHF